MRWRIAFVLCVLMLAPISAGADTARIEAAWRTWLAASGAPDAALAITKDGVVVHVASAGQDPDTAVPIASLSKALTGICLYELQREGHLRLDAPLGTYMANASTEMRDVPLSTFMTHRAGTGEDSAQGFTTRDARAGGGLNQRVLRGVLAGSARPGEFTYTNEGFVVLTGVIERIMGADYFEVCAPRLGIEIPETMVYAGTAGWGGWSLSPRAYGEVIGRYFSPAGFDGRPPNLWASATLQRGRIYGFGMFSRPLEGGWAHWHSGRFCFRGGVEVGSYTLQMPSGWGAVTTFKKCLSRDQSNALDLALFEALAVR